MKLQYLKSPNRYHNTKSGRLQSEFLKEWGPGASQERHRSVTGMPFLRKKRDRRQAVPL